MKSPDISPSGLMRTGTSCRSYLLIPPLDLQHNGYCPMWRQHKGKALNAVDSCQKFEPKRCAGSAKLMWNSSLKYLHPEPRHVDRPRSTYNNGRASGDLPWNNRGLFVRTAAVCVLVRCSALVTKLAPHLFMKVTLHSLKLEACATERACRRSTRKPPLVASGEQHSVLPHPSDDGDQHTSATSDRQFGWAARR